jgi:hypothetical protein
MPRKTRHQKVQELLELLKAGPDYQPDHWEPSEAYASFLGARLLPRLMELIPEVWKVVNDEQRYEGAERLRLDQEAWALQSEPNPPYEKR